MAIHFPEDIVSLFSITTRDVIWFKDKFIRILKKESIPEAVLIEIEKRIKEKEPTVKLCQYLVDELEKKGDEGIKIIQTLMTSIANWKDFSHLKQPDKIELAKSRQIGFKRAIREFANERSYKLEREKESQAQRIERTKISNLDHNKLQEFRDRFDKIFIMGNRRERGERFEELMNDIFSYYCQKNLGPFERKGEQIDGQFYFDGHYYLVEVRWREQKSKASDISILRGRAQEGFGGDVRALFISFNGFTRDCIENLEEHSNERVILMDGDDLRCVLNADIAFDVLLDKKLALAVREKRPLVSAREIIFNKIENNISL